MNERIEQLAVQAGIDFFNSIDPDPEFFGRAYCEAWTEQQQKFAELIVKECADIANAGIDPNESHLIGDDIKEHFGVEK